MTPQGTVTLTADQRRRLAAAEEVKEEMVRVTFDASLLADDDIVLTTYDVLERRSALFMKVSSCYCVLL